MKTIIFLLSLSTAVSGAAQFSPSRGYLGNYVGNSDKNNKMELITQNNAKKFTSGYLRTDTYDWLRDSWLQAQVLPIGQCFRDSNNSALISEVTITADSVLRVSQIYHSLDCSGSFSTVPLVHPTAEIHNPFQILITHEEKLDVALQLVYPYTDSIIVTSYYSPDGCSGAAAQYDILPMYSACAVYTDYAAMITCDMKASVLVLEKFEPTAAETINYPFCDPAQYLRTEMQPFACSDQRAPRAASGSDDASAPVFQTVQCFAAPIQLLEE